MLPTCPYLLKLAIAARLFCLALKKVSSKDVLSIKMIFYMLLKIAHNSLLQLRAIRWVVMMLQSELHVADVTEFSGALLFNNLSMENSCGG